MKIFCSLNNFLGSPAARRKFIVTMGIFDGVHGGHQKVIKVLRKKARDRRLSSLLITFHPHPANVLSPTKKVPLLISLKHRLRLLARLGIDYVIVLRFDKRLSRMTVGDFIEKVLGKIKIHEIVIGENFFFGKNRKGSFKSLKGYRVSVVDAVRSSGKLISSTRIRRLISRGRLMAASKLLQGPVTVLGTVVKGHKRGRFIGFPTANIDPHHEAIPPSGVYAVRVKLAKKIYKGILNIGFRPTFRKSQREYTIEVHIFNFNKSIYGKDLEIAFVKKIRKEKRFKNNYLLGEQIRKDEKLARRLLL